MARYQHVNLLRVALPLFASFALIRIAFYLLRRVFARHGPVGAAILTFEKIFALLVWLAVALYITGLWPDIFHYLDNTLLPLGRHKVSLADHPAGGGVGGGAADAGAVGRRRAGRAADGRAGHPLARCGW